MKHAARGLGPNSRLRIIVLGYIVRGPLGGMAWHHLQYVLGLARLGHDVYFVEDSDDYESCYNPVTFEMSTDPAYGLGFAGRAFGAVGLGERWAYWDAHTSRWLGPAGAGIQGVCAGADLLLNVSGVNPLRPWLADIPARALLDTDPVFTQVRHLTDAQARRAASGHTAFFSFGENIGRGPAAIPDDGLPWQPTRQPVVLDAWPVTPGPPEGKFRTVMQWDSYPALRWSGRRYGLKCDSFGAYLELPRRTGELYELAVTRIPGEARELLQAHGWAVGDPAEPSRDPWSYQRYLQESRAEFSVAKHGYVVTRSGWFSERSACYLASGRPVVVQETGFSDWLPRGLGVHPFTTLEEAAAGVEAVNSRYQQNCKAARDLAAEYFDAGKVLTRLIDSALNPHPRPALPEGARGEASRR
jgi:hypothetical protein